MTNRIEKKSKSTIDLLRIQILPLPSQTTTDLINEILCFLKPYGIKRSQSKPALKYFKQGFLLSTVDQSKSICGSIKWDGLHHYVQLELSGSGCNYFNVTSGRFKGLYDFALAHQGVLREIDIAVDDFSGKYTLRRINQDYTQGKFTGERGCVPRRRLINSDGAKTIRIGSRNSFKQLNAYDKSREQNLLTHDPRFGLWTRLEVSLYARQGTPLELNCLLEPDPYFIGAYPKALGKMIKGVAPRCIVRAQAIQSTIDFYRSVSSLKKQWGKTINGLQEILQDDEQVLNVVTRQGLPKSLALPSYLPIDLLATFLKPQLLALVTQKEGAAR